MPDRKMKPQHVTEADCPNCGHRVELHDSDGAGECWGRVGRCTCGGTEQLDDDVKESAR